MFLTNTCFLCIFQGAQEMFRNLPHEYVSVEHLPKVAARGSMFNFALDLSDFVFSLLQGTAELLLPVFWLLSICICICVFFMNEGWPQWRIVDLQDFLSLAELNKHEHSSVSSTQQCCRSPGYYCWSPSIYFSFRPSRSDHLFNAQFLLAEYVLALLSI